MARKAQRGHLAGHGRSRALHQDPGGKPGLRRQPIELALLGRGEEPHSMSSFMSRTARSIPTSTALQTIAYPMFSSVTSSIRATGRTFQ